MDRANRVPTSKDLIYRYIAEQGAASKSELLERFRIPSSTLTRTLEEMTADRLIQASGLGPSSGGRRPIVYETNPAFGYFFGLEISRSHASLGFFDVRMNPMSFTRWRMDEAMTPDKLIAHAEQTVKAILFDHKIEPGQVKGFGIGAVGPLDRERGIVLRPLHFAAPGWHDVPICRMAEEAIGFKTRLENGANAALMGERWALRRSNPQHMLYVHAGIGLRSAMMSNGRIVHGSIDLEGAVGQMIIQADGTRLHEGGNFGALEAYASIQALEKQAQSQAKLGRGGWTERLRRAPEQIRYDDVLQALREGHPPAVELFDGAAVYLGIGLANMINMFHPETVILGGSLIYSDERFYRTAIETARQNVYYYPTYQPVFTKGELREDAVATGAALMMWRGMEI